MNRAKAVWYVTIVGLLLYAQLVWAVQDDGSLGAGFIASLTTSLWGVWVPAFLSIGFVSVVFLMLTGRGPAWIQKFGSLILAILVVGGFWSYITQFSGGAVSMTFVLPGF